MKTLQELQQDVTEARQAYANAAALPLRTTRDYVLSNRQRDVRLALRELIAAKRRVQVHELRAEVASLKAENAKLSEAHSAESAEVQRLTARCNGLIADLARETKRADEFAAEAGVQAQRAKDYESGHTEVRDLLKETNPPADRVGTIAQVKWLIEEAATLRAVNKARAEAQRTTSPEVQAAIDKIAGSRGLKALAVPTDNITLATIRAWWAITTEEKRRTDAYSVLSEIILPPHERGTTWIGVLWGLRAADVTIGELPMNVGKTGKVDRISAVSARKVTVGTEERGPEWGEGRAAAQFEALRQENARTPLGKRTEHDLKNNIIPLRPESADDLPKAN
jgi:hypothetical protein